MKIALIETENSVSDMIEKFVQSDSLEVVKYSQYRDLILEPDLEQYDLIAIDMRHQKCIEIITYIKQTSNVPVRYLTDRYKKSRYETDIDDKEFIIHSYTKEEFVESIMNFIQKNMQKKVDRLGDFEIDHTGGVLKYKNMIFSLSPLDVEICSALIRNVNKVLSPKMIVDEIDKYGQITTETSMREHIRIIRKEFKKININPITTVKGSGYKWEN
ncbi:MAG: winged helix-turn-helix domain-containing protein [Peptoniphilaceae bacterium]|nr:winged helix-turn-helix domain-containing protein [Peptoniphilaceae bacterium]MDD7383085.1 winged helix-turn-helix domain-containing protein [Peptoniphilaceae bacterium]MDY3737520.1 winged helix-turn-helix domain-containing protein [Peptoniphilaceae bacterium]